MSMFLFKGFVVSKVVAESSMRGGGGGRVGRSWKKRSQVCVQPAVSGDTSFLWTFIHVPTLIIARLIRETSR